MSKFHKIAGDKHSSTMRHEDGHEIKIAHAALSALQRKQLERMPLAEGGELPAHMHGESGGNSNPKLEQAKIRNPQPKVQMYPDGGEVGLEQGGSGREAPSTPPPAPTPSDLSSEAANFFQSAKHANGGKVQHYAESDIVSKDDSDSSSAPDQSSQHTININVGQPQPQEPMGQVPAIQGFQTPAGVDTSKLNIPQVSPAGVQLNPNKTVNAAGNIAQEGQANTDIAKIQGARAQGQAQLEQQAANVEQQKADATNKLAQQHIDEFNQFAQELPNIDSNHYMNSMSAPGKIATALGVFLGSAPTGHGGSNTALDFLNKQIDRDVQAQIQNKDKVRNIYAAYQQLYGDSQAAVDMTKGSMLSILGHQANIIANKLGTPMAQAQMNKLNAEIGQQQAGAARSAAFDAVMNTPKGPGQPVSNGPAASGSASPQPETGPTAGMTPKEKGAFQQFQKNTGQEDFKPDQILAPDANSRLAYEAKTNPYMSQDYGDLKTQLGQARQVDKVLNGIGNDGVGGVHDLFNELYSSSGSGKWKGALDAAQRQGKNVSGLVAAAATGLATKSPTMAALADVIGKVDVPEFTESQKKYALVKEKMKAELGSALKGVISVGDLDRMIDKYSPGFMDSPELVSEKEAKFRDTLKKALDTSALERYPGFLANKPK